jgi:serine/threonine protein kinase
LRVTQGGRVVVLDFGVATELRSPRNGDRPVETEVVGTATYMAPEQAMGEPPVAASDWYSVGVMLYEAMIGEPPHVGPALEVITNKCLVDPIAPSARVPRIPEDLDVLCVELLAVDAAKRPTGDQLLSRLRASAPSRSSSKQPAAAPMLADLVGRDAQLARLREAVDATRAGHAVCVQVSGATGTGKSALVFSGRVPLIRSRATS